MNDPVRHPAHYNQYDIEVIWLTEVFDYCLGNAIKYVMRAPHKENERQDLDKAMWYMCRYKEYVLLPHEKDELSIGQSQRLILFTITCYKQLNNYQRHFLKRMIVPDFSGATQVLSEVFPENTATLS